MAEESQLITTPGGSASNSMITADEAGDYIAASLYSVATKAAWKDKEQAEVESLLILGSLAFGNLPWLGWLCYRKQAMPWPRWPFPRDINPRMTRRRRNYASICWEWWEGDYTAENAIFPDNVKKALAYFCCDVLDRALRGRTDPSEGPAQDAIGSLSLFGDISLSSGEYQEKILMGDGFSLLALLRAGHPEIYLLLSPYVTEVNFIGDWRDFEPALLPEVKEA